MTITSNNRDGKQNICKYVTEIFSGFNQYLSPRRFQPEIFKTDSTLVLEGFTQVLTETRDR